MPQSQYNLSGSGSGSGAGNIDVENAGTPLGNFDTINVTGAGATASDAGGGVAEINVPGGGGGVDVEDGGSGLGSFTTLNFAGAGVTASDAGGGEATITIPGGSSVDVEDEGSGLGAFTAINFVGAGVTASDAGGGLAEITIPGGGSGVDAEDEGAPLGSFTTINFVGAGVTASDAGGGVLDVDVPGGGGGGGGGVTQTNAVYVSKAGNDANSGLRVGAPKLTIASAIAAASGLTPSPTNRVTIWVQDGGTYVENVTLPANVSLDGDGATVEGAISLGVRSRLRLHRVVYSPVSGIAVLFNSGFGDAWVDVDEIDRTGGGIFGAAVRGAFGASSRLNLRVGRIIVSDSVALWADAGIITGSIDEIVITNAGYGVYVPGARVSLQIDSIRDTGSATIGVNIFPSGTAFLFVGELNTNNTYTVAGTLNMFAGQITGTIGTISGTANVTVA